MSAPPPTPPATPRVLEVDLTVLEEGGEPPVARPFSHPDPAVERIGCWGGSALGLALLHDVAGRDGEEIPLVLSVGEAVARGLPTAARLTVASRGPLTGLYEEGLVGSEFGPRLVGAADALVIRGRTDLAGAVLVIGRRGRPRLESLPQLVGTSPTDAWRILYDHFGLCGALRIGPAGERGVAFATVAAGGREPSFTGRAGLGAVLGRLGLKAICVTAPLPPESFDSELVRALLSSPRLKTRGGDCTFELWHAFAARGDLLARNYSQLLAPREGTRLATESREMAGVAYGCRGCPTRCGRSYERPQGQYQHSRFGATYSLGPNLGIESFQEALELVAASDSAGLDAREVGAVLAIGCAAGELEWGDRAAFQARIEEMASGRGEGLRYGRGSEALALELGLIEELYRAKGQAARPEKGLAAVLGQCVSTGGSDPMRIFPFLSTDASDRTAFEELCGGLDLPPGAEDLHDPAGTGRLVWWHENLKASLDASGFCAFSAGGILSDGLVSLDQLAEHIAPAALLEDEQLAPLAPGQRLIAAGASIALLRRELGVLWGAPDDWDRPAWAREQLALPGMLDEYLACRGLDADGRPHPEARAALGTERLARPLRTPWARPAGAAEKRSAPTHPQAPGVVVLRAAGPLGEIIGGELRLELELPVSLDAAVAELERVEVEARPWLRPRGRLVAAVYRRGRRVDPGEAVADGDELDLVVAISGG